MESIKIRTIALCLYGLFATGLLVFRIAFTGELSFLFLTWNLFLAYIPLGLSTLVYIKRNDITPPQFLLVSMPWLLFFPNAPYLLTDLFHLLPRNGIPLWYDLLLILSFAITGLLFGLFSLRNMHRVLLRFYSAATGYLFAIGAIFLAAFGVYLGRFERYNSWDLFRTPDELFIDIAQRLVHPLHHPSTWGMTIGFGVMLTLLYLMMRRVQREKDKI